MRKFKTAGLSFVFLLTLVSYNNCAKKNFSSPDEVGTETGNPLAVSGEDGGSSPGSEKCQNQTQKVHRQTITFEDPMQYCPWAQADNATSGDGGKRDGFVQARIEQKRTIEALPNSTEICSLKFNFKNISVGGVNAKFYYDDHFIFTFNNIVIAATKTQIVNKFSSENGLFSYDWQKIVGMTGAGGENIAGTSDVYCPGMKDGSSTCKWPETESTGVIDINISAAIIQKISDLRNKANQHEFAFITTGDNDNQQMVNGKQEPKDCRHSTISFDIEMHYVE